jgi:hypothetical protein
MNAKGAKILVAVFVVLHLCVWFYFFYIDLYSSFMHRYYVAVHGYPRDWLDTGRLISSFPIGPFSGILWGCVLYGILRLLSRKRK